MSTTFMLMNNPMDLIMNLVVNTTVNTDQMVLEGAIEKYKVDFDAASRQAIFTFKMYDSSKLGDKTPEVPIEKSENKLNKKNLEELTSTEHFFQVVNIFGLTINMAKSKKKSLAIKVDMEHSYVYLEDLSSNDGTIHKFHGWLEH